MNIITTPEQLDELVDYYSKQDAFAFDVETVGDRRGDTPINTVLWISLATYGRGDVIPMGHPNGELLGVTYPLTGQGQKRIDKGLPARPSDYSRSAKLAVHQFSEPPTQLYPAQVFTSLKPLMFDDSKLTIGHNLVFDLTSVAKYYGGEVPTGPYFDTMIGSFLYDNANKNKCSLDDCLYREFKYEMVKGVGKEVEKYDFHTVAKYAYLDAKYTFMLWKVVRDKLAAVNLTKVMDLEMDVLSVLCDMKLTGAPIDKGALYDLDARLKADIEKAKSNIFATAGKVFNMNSNSEKQELLFSPKSKGGRGLKPKMLTPGGKKTREAGEDLDLSNYSVSAEALKEYASQDILVSHLLEYADLNKMYSTYVVPYLGGDIEHTTNGKTSIEHKDSLLINDRIHCSFIQHGAETGRFSSKNPNLQNIPAPNDKIAPEEDKGRAIRNLFIAPEGHKLIVADYSQIEPRIIASMSGDPALIKNYLEGGDVYTLVGDTMGVGRKSGKVLVLSIAYGTGAKNISNQIGCTKEEAEDLLTRFNKLFPAVMRYKRAVIKATRDNNPPYISTIFGRRRYLPEITSRDSFRRESAERQAFNTRIQGSAADIIKLAMVRAHQMIPKEAKLILTVHDELVTISPDHLVDETWEAIRAAMEDIDLLKVPLTAGITCVQRWGEAK